MENLSDKNDIGSENYKGPSQFAAGAGEGFIAHIQWAIIGLVAGGAVGFVFHKPLQPLIDRWRAGANRLRAVKDEGFAATFTRGWGKFTTAVLGTGELNTNTKKAISQFDPLDLEAGKHWFYDRQHGFGNWFINHTVGLIPPVGKWIHKKFTEQLNIAATFGGIFAFVGYFFVPPLLFPEGARKAARGRRQFERAQDEIWDLRAQNEILRSRDQESRRGHRDDGNEETQLGETSEQPQVRDHKTPETPKHAMRSEHRESPGRIDPPIIEAPEPAAPPVRGGKASAVEDSVDLKESPGRIDPPVIEAPQPAAPPVKGGKASAIDHAKGDREWAELARDRAEASAEHTVP